MKDKIITLMSPLVDNTINNSGKFPSIDEAKQQTDKTFKELVKKRLKI